MNSLYVVNYTPGPAWLQDTSVFKQPLQEHLAYMKSLFASGVLKLGGPFTDDRGGLIVVGAADVHAARAIVDADPAVRAGVMVAEAHPWTILAGAL